MTPLNSQSLTNQLHDIQLESGMSWPQFAASVLALAQNRALMDNALNKSRLEFGKPAMKISLPIET